jgi:hypothetical protein
MSTVIDITERLRCRRIAADFCGRAALLDDRGLGDLLEREPDTFVDAAHLFDSATCKRVVRLLLRTIHGAEGGT